MHTIGHNIVNTIVHNIVHTIGHTYCLYTYPILYCLYTQYAFFREIPCLQLCLLLLVEELRRGYTKGHPIKDYSLPDDHPFQIFMAFVCLLLISGDYPGLGKVAAQTRAGYMGCSMCYQFFERILGTTGAFCGINNRAATPPDHPIRDDVRLGTDSSNPARNKAPKLRTHEEEVNLGKYMSYFGNGNQIPDEEYESLKKATGRKGFCVFALVHMFNIIQDFLLDWMHILKGMYAQHLRDFMPNNTSI